MCWISTLLFPFNFIILMSMLTCNFVEQFCKNVLKYLVSGNKLDHNTSVEVQISTLLFSWNLSFHNFYFTLFLLWLNSYNDCISTNTLYWTNNLSINYFNITSFPYRQGKFPIPIIVKIINCKITIGDYAVTMKCFGRHYDNQH